MKKGWNGKVSSKDFKPQSPYSLAEEGLSYRSSEYKVGVFFKNKQNEWTEGKANYIHHRTANQAVILCEDNNQYIIPRKHYYLPEEEYIKELIRQT